MVNNSPLLFAIDQLIMVVGGVAAIGARGLGKDDLADHAVLSLHNHIGNAKHFIHDHETSFNGSEQFLSARSALKELEGASTNILVLRRESVLGPGDHDRIETQIRNVAELLRRDIDPEYTGS